MTSLLPMDTLAATVEARIDKGDKAHCDGDRHYLAAGLHLIEARQRIDAGENQKFKTFSAFFVGGCHLSRSRAYELIAIADGTTTAQAVRANNRQRDAKRRAKQKTSVSHGQTIQETENLEEECLDCDMPQDFWQRSLGNMAGDAISMRAFWTRQFGDWEKFERPSTLVTLAKQAADAWKTLAADLEETNDERAPLAANETYTAIKEYQHIFAHGTCHLLPTTIDYEGPEWVQWRADHPGGWLWRHREVDAQGSLRRNTKGRCIRPGPWLTPDGSKPRNIDPESPEGRAIFAAWKLDASSSGTH